MSTPLLVPMHVDAMVLNQAASTATPFRQFQPDYSQLRNFRGVGPRPFETTTAITTKPPAGIYLHWTLPRALRRGSVQADGSTAYPLVPNRWLVVRLQGGTKPPPAAKTWLVESDFIDATAGASAFVDPSAGADGMPHPTRIGAIHDFETLTAIPTLSRDPFLRATGAGDASFSVFAPGVQGVFAFTDPVTGIDAATFTYHVIGWYDSAAADPLAAARWEASVDPELAGAHVEASLGFVVYADASGLPDSMLVHALVSGVPWSRGAPNSQANTYPEPHDVKVAIGNTSVDALAALVAQTGTQAQADLLEAFQYGLLDRLDQPGSAESLGVAITDHWYGASPGGSEWTIVAAEGSDAAVAPAALNQDQASALAELNAVQRECDRQQRILESMRWTLLSLWWKATWSQPRRLNRIPVTDGRLQSWLPGQLQSHVTQTGAWYLGRVQAQQQLAGGLAAETAKAGNAVTALLGPELELKELALPEYRAPNDPVVLMTGLGRASNLDPVGDVTCRVTAQTVAALDIGGTRYVAGAGGGRDMTAAIPALADPHGLLPQGVADLHRESFFLSPALFAENALGDTSDTGKQAVRDAISALPPPAAATRFAPAPGSMDEWAQPWVPLLLEWQVTVLAGPAYRALDPKSPVLELDAGMWRFDGTDYTWTGPTDSAAYDVVASAPMTLTGRTFITPHLSFSLADQLDRYVSQHGERSDPLQQALGQLDQAVDQLATADILSQRLGGLRAQLVQRDLTPGVGPSGAVLDALTDNSGRRGDEHGNPLPFKAAVTPPVWDFAPMCGTFLVVNRLSVIDFMGRTVDVTLGNYNAWSGAANADPQQSFYPVPARGFATWATRPLSPAGMYSSPDEPVSRMVQLPPRLVQDARLAFRPLSNDGADTDIALAPGANPVCGWVVPNHLDRSLAVYAPDGTAWGELYLSLEGSNRFVPRWQPDPTSDAAPQSVADVPNVHVRTWLEALCARPDNGIGFQELLQAIDETLWGIDAQGAQDDLDLAVLVGRPIAIARAGLSLSLRGLPRASQDWGNTFAVDPANLPASDPAPLRTVDGGVLSSRWAVRLGSPAIRSDGLVGYFADDPRVPANTYAALNCVRVPEDARSGYIRPIGGQAGNYPALMPVDDSVTEPDPARGQVVRLTLLLDPRGVVHAFSGILPAVTLAVPTAFVTPALRKLSYLFRAGPFLTSPDEVRVPPPAEQRGSWQWFDRVLGASTPIASADDRVRLPTTPPLVKEGWLKFTPNPRIEGDQSAGA